MTKPSRRNKLILVMIDGVSADYFARYRNRLPHLAALAAAGTVVERMRPEVCATSLPGRTSIITGVSASTHGVYGNRIWDGQRFRYANPDDVRAPSIARQALDAGLDVAAIGYAMIKPEDTTTFTPPWWVRDWVQRGRDSAPLPIDPGWQRTLTQQDPHGRLAALAAAGLPAELPPRASDDPALHVAMGCLSDHIMLQWCAGLAVSAAPPDLILTEINMTDEIQHDHGFASDAAHWSVATADTLVGLLVSELRRAGRLDDYVIAVTSDHGHSPIDVALYPEVVIPGARWGSEGSMLHVAPRNRTELRDITARLAEFGVEYVGFEHTPVDQHEQMAAFAAPPRMSFETKPSAVPANTPTGKPKAISSHGLRPGSAEDDRFAIFQGPRVNKGSVADAAAEQFAPTLAALLGLTTDIYPAPPIIGAV